MCTAVTFKGKDHYFGRNLDLEYSLQESVIITPRNFSLHFRKIPTITNHFAMIGMAVVSNEYPLYYDATNECGLSIAGLNFPGNAIYYPQKENTNNIAPFELIPWILCQCKTVSDAEDLLKKCNILQESFSPKYKVTPLHWMISDEKRSITVETLEEGMRIYKNPVGILTNNPPFDFHMYHLNNYMNLTHMEPVNRFSESIPLAAYSRGMGAIGLPGDLSSSSRFIRAAYTKFNSVCGATEEESVNQFFHILGSVSQQKGCVRTGKGYEMTVYSSCCNVNKGIYYYKTYENSQITGVNMNNVDLDGEKLIQYPLRTKINIFWEEN